MVVRSLKGKLFVAVIFLGVLPFSLSVAVAAYWDHQRLGAEARDRLAKSPLPVLRQIEALLYARWNDVHLLAHMPLFRDIVGAEYQTAILRRAAELYRPYALLALADERGRVIASSDQDFVHTDAYQSQWFQEARKISAADWDRAARSVYISQPYVPQRSDGRPVMCFNSPVYNFEGRFLGVIHSEVKLGVLFPFLANLRVGETGRALLVREDGKVLLDDRGGLRSLEVSMAGHPAFARARGGELSLVRDKDIDGDSALLSTFQIKGFGQYPGVKWFLIVSQKEKEIYAPVRRMLMFHSIAAFLGVSLIFLGGFVLFDRNISKPVTHLMEGIRSLSARGLTRDIEVPIRSKDEIGELARAFKTMVLDLAAKEQAQRELQDQLAQKERLAAIGEMVAGVAHQIKNPLATIKVASQSLSEELLSQAPAQAALARIDREVNRLNRFLQAFFNFAAPSAPQKSRCGLRAIVQEALSHVEEELIRAGVRVSELYSDDLPPLFVDAQRLLQAFTNLFRNAIQAMPNGGVLSVAAETGRPGNGTGVEASAPWVSVRISDTGCGIASENLKKIFRPFFTTRASGTGLGLSFVYKVVEGHGGEVRASSQPGQGSTFELFLPAMKESDDRESPSRIEVSL